MKTILSILDEIAATSSKNEKTAILRREAENGMLQRVFQLTYDKSVRFWQTEREPSLQMATSFTDLNTAFDGVEENVCSRKISGNAARNFMQLLAGRLTPDDREVFWRVIERDLRVGCSETTANKVWPGLIPEQDFMLAESDMGRISFPAYCQVKADGVRAHLVWNGTAATLWTRGNNVVEVGDIFDADMRAAYGTTPITLDGELVCFKDYSPLDRKTSNGIINKAIKGTIKEADVSLINFLAWDAFFQDRDDRPYIIRLEALQNTLDEAEPDRIYLIESHVVDDAGSAYVLYKIWRKQGHEGALLKNMRALWKGKRVFDLCKMKAVVECEFRVIAVEEGTGKYKGKMGAMVMTDLDKRIEFNVGTGFSDEERGEYWTNKPIGAVFTVAYNERITAKGRDKESLFLPRSMGIRLDKTEPDSYDKIVATEKALLE